MKKFDFNKDVVEVSFNKFVLVYFTADWCGPCKILGPLLSELELESFGKWLLVKIDIEDEQEIAAYFKIQNIPNCKLIFEGKIVDEFNGVQTKEIIKQWLTKNVLTSKTDDIEEIEAEIDDFEEIISAELNIPDSVLCKTLESFVSAHPEHETALLAYLKHEVFFNPKVSIQKLKSLSNEKVIEDLSQYFEVVEEFIDSEIDPKTLVGNLLMDAKKSLLSGNSQQAIDLLIQCLHQDSKFGNEIARRFGISLFKIWGNQSPLTKENRKLFDMAIW